MALDDAGDDTGQIGLGIDAVQLGGLDQRGQDRPVFTAAVGAGEQGVLARQRQGADGAFDGVVVDLDATVGEEQGQARPARQGVADGLGQLGLLADGLQPGAQPGLQGLDQRISISMA
jgi:hypothetical protein